MHFPNPASALAVALAAALFTGCDDPAGPEAACPDDGFRAVQTASPCSTADSLCTRYLAIWQVELRRRNGMTEDWFDRHIAVRHVSFDSWNDGISFRVSYTVRIAWVSVDEHDKFIVFRVSSASGYDDVPIPRDVYLDDGDITLVLDREVSNSSMNRINPIEELAFCSEVEALQALRLIAKTDGMVVDRYRYWGGHRPLANGNPWLEGEAEIDLDQNRCASGRMDLVTGEGEAYETACWVF